MGHVSLLAVRYFSNIALCVADPYNLENRMHQHLSMFPSGHVIKDLEQVVTVGRQQRIKQAIIIPRRMFTK